MNGLFLRLETDAKFFEEFVTHHYRQSPPVVSDWFTCDTAVSSARVQYAYREYAQNVGKFSVLLESKNPDHYKRAGALLHALYQSKIATKSDLLPGKFGSVDELEGGTTMVSHGDAQHVLRFVSFYNEYFNQLFAFEMAYRCCSMYEAKPRQYDFDYLHNMCRYLKVNNNLNVDSCFMIFKSLML